MGAWGVSVFQDDSGFDWLDKFCRSRKPVELLQSAISKVLDNDTFIMYNEAVAALTAAEVVAACLGEPSDSYPEENYFRDEWMDEDDRAPRPDLRRIGRMMPAELTEQSIAVVEKIKTFEGCELRIFWQDSPQYAEWQAGLDDLSERLSD
jgi:Domain of unknown function (DUF4259)